MEKIVITGTLTTEWLPQLNINTLVRNGYIREGKIMGGNFQAKESDPELYIESDLTTNNRFVKIKYKSLLTSKEIERRINIAATPVNLGKDRGMNLYWLCSVSNQKAKVLYYDYWNELYVHRKAYPHRIYYPLEICSKDDRAYERGYIVQKKLLKALLDFKNYSYGGDMTNIHKRIEKLVKKERAIQLLKDERDDKLYQKFCNKYPEI